MNWMFSSNFKSRNLIIAVFFSRDHLVVPRVCCRFKKMKQAHRFVEDVEGLDHWEGLVLLNNSIDLCSQIITVRDRYTFNAHMNQIKRLPDHLIRIRPMQLHLQRQHLHAYIDHHLVVWFLIIDHFLHQHQPLIHHLWTPTKCSPIIHLNHISIINNGQQLLSNWSLAQYFQAYLNIKICLNIFRRHVHLYDLDHRVGHLLVLKIIPY